MWHFGFGRNRGLGYGRGMRVGGMGGRGTGAWPGNGPFSYLPPWERPGWIYGRGACWRFLYGSPDSFASAPTIVFPSYNSYPDDKAGALRREAEYLETRLKEIHRMMEELDG